MDEQTRKALELAREALEWPAFVLIDKAIAAIDAALSAPAAPVAQPSERAVSRPRHPPGECAATGQSCEQGPHGPGGSTQCRYCGASPALLLADEVGLIGPASRTHDLHAAIERFYAAATAPAPASQPLTEGFVQVPVSALMELKADVNTLACLSLKAERWQKGAQVKTTIAGLIDGIGQGGA